MEYERALNELNQQLDSLNKELYGSSSLTIDEIQELNYQINMVYQEMGALLEDQIV